MYCNDAPLLRKAPHDHLVARKMSCPSGVCEHEKHCSVLALARALVKVDLFCIKLRSLMRQSLKPLKALSHIAMK